MKLKKYFDDLNDFDDESKRMLLSYKNSIISLEDFQNQGYGSFRDIITHDKIQLGETIRGMNNVSPLVTQKFYNQSLEQITRKYFIDSDSPIEGTFTYIPDKNSDLTPVIKTTVKDFYYYGVEHVNNFAFKVVVFSSTEATKLKECFEVSNPTGRQIFLFVEDNSGDNASGTYGAIKISNDVLTFLNRSGRLEYDLYNNEEVYKEIRKVIPELSDDQIKNLLQNGYIEDIRVDIAKTYFKLASFFSGRISSINPGLGIMTNDLLRKSTSKTSRKNNPAY